MGGTKNAKNTGRGRTRREPTSPDTPDEGTLVRVRGDNWVVTAVEPSPPDQAGTPCTLVHLQSVADGRFGETLAVIWETEPARVILTRGSLPDVAAGRFDDPEQLAALLNAVRWSAVTSADVRTLQAPFRSGVAVEPYQLEPVARALGAPRVNLLLADDVGLGKTVEAGLVAQELLLRGRAARIMIVCPAGLTLKWRDEMHEKFGLDFTVIDSAQCAELRRTRGTAANPFRAYPLSIVSLPWLRRPKAQRLLEEVIGPAEAAEAAEGDVPADPTDPNTPTDSSRAPHRSRRVFDLLILDEAHHIAPAVPQQRYAVDSQQTRLIRRLAAHFEHRLFLSATPHNGYNESFTALLEIIDNQRFARGVTPDRDVLKGTLVRRLKRTIIRPDGTPRFRRRRSEIIEVDYTEAERSVHALLTRFTELRRARTSPQATGSHKATDLVTLLLKKRLFSSPAAFAHTVAVYRNRLAQDRARTLALDVPPWLTDFADHVADLADTELAEEEDTALFLTTRLTPGADREELDLLADMERWALTHEATPDSRAAALLRYLKAVCRAGDHWTHERVVVFTEYRDTQQWLYDLLRQEGLTGDGRVVQLHGGLTTEDRETIRLGFQAHPGSPEGATRILLATDAAGEGIDLQRYCHRLVNYDIPFNPNKLEQRIGRIDRWGQREDPEVRHFIGTGWQDAADGSYDADLEFLARIAQKMTTMTEALGEANAVINETVQRRMAGHPARPDDLTTIDNATRAGTGTIPTEDNVTAQTQRLAAQYEQSVEELGITPDNIKRVVDTALALTHQQPLTPADLLDGMSDTLLTTIEDEPYDPAAPDFAQSLFTVPPLHDTWVRATRGLAHRLRPTERRPITFDPAVAAQGRDDVVLAHLSHPLVSMSTGLLRAAVWNSDAVGLHRVAAVVSDDPRLETALVSAYARFVLVGSDGTRLHEEILHAGGWLGENGWLRRWESVGEQRRTLHHALTRGTKAEPYLTRPYVQQWNDRISKRLDASLQARARELRASLDNRLAQRRQEETARVDATFDRFDATLRDRLKEEGQGDNEQTVLFGTHELTGAEQRQHREDRQRWKRRLDALGTERAREHAAIAARYGDLRSHLFPVAVVFVIPHKEAIQ
ncbi:DISARM system SNF2-like helicase DrmD [Streptomyces xiamenensis]